MKKMWELLKPRLGTWASTFKPLYDRGIFDEIYGFLKVESRQGKKIAPLSSDTFRCFIKTPINRLKAVVLGYCPYHTRGRDNVYVADGLALSCSKTGVLAPSLDKWYGALEEEFNNGLCLSCKKEPDLSYLSEMGVLLLNSALTVEVEKAGSHNKIWKPFTNHIMSIIGAMDVPVIFLGNEAAEFGHHIEKEENKFFLFHPAYASYKRIKWDSKGSFKAVNDILIKKRIEPIDWLQEAPF